MGSILWRGSVYSALAQENFGIAVADALSCGTIALISDKVNIAGDLSSDGAALVEANTLEGTQALIARFSALPEGDRVRMRSRAKECYERRYSLQDAAQAIYRALGLSTESMITPGDADFPRPSG